MAELILTENEKKASTYLEWSDEAIGKTVKCLALKIQDMHGDRAAMLSAAAFLLASIAEEMNSDNLEYDLESMTVGKWKVAVRRI